MDVKNILFENNSLKKIRLEIAEEDDELRKIQIRLKEGINIQKSLIFFKKSKTNIVEFCKSEEEYSEKNLKNLEDEFETVSNKMLSNDRLLRYIKSEIEKNNKKIDKLLLEQ